MLFHLGSADICIMNLNCWFLCFTVVFAGVSATMVLTKINKPTKTKAS